MGEVSRNVYNIYSPKFVGFAQDHSALTYENAGGIEQRGNLDEVRQNTRTESETSRQEQTATRLESETMTRQQCEELQHEEVRKKIEQHLQGNKTSSAWKTDLYRMAWHEETINSLHDVKEFPLALGVHKGFHTFNSSQKDLGFLMRYCITAMLLNQEIQGQELLEKILVLVQSMGETFHSVLSLAEYAIQKGKNFDAIMFCLVAAKMSEIGNLTLIAGAYKSKCMVVLRDAAGRVTEKTKRAKPFIQRYCVEAIRPLFEDVMKTTTTNNAKNVIELKIATFHCMEILQLYADDDEGRAKTVERAMEFLRTTYGQNVNRRKWYGILSHNLGCTYLKLSRNQEAAAMLVQAYDVLTKATDFDDHDEEVRNLTNTKNMLKATGIGGLINVSIYI